MAKANPSAPGRVSTDAPALTPNPVIDTGTKVERNGVPYLKHTLMNGDERFTRVDLDPRFDRGRRGSK
jgi:hypothetical protein